PPRSTLFPYTTLFRSQTHAGRLATAAAGSVRRLQIFLDGGDLSVAVRDRRFLDAVGQADGRVYAADAPHDHFHRRNADGNGFPRDRKSTRLNSSHVSI